MWYLGNGNGHRVTNHITNFDDVNIQVANFSAVAELGEIDESSRSDSNVISDEDDDYGYNHNRLIHEDEEWDTMTDGLGGNDCGMGENDEEVEDDDWESMYMD